MLQGTLAQFSRTSLVQDLGRRLVADFAERLNSRLEGGSAASAPPPPRRSMPAICSGTWLRDRLRRLFGG